MGNFVRWYTKGQVKTKHTIDFAAALVTLGIAVLVVFGLKPDSKIGRNAWKIGT